MQASMIGELWVRTRRFARRILERLGLIGFVYRVVERRAARRAGPWATEADGLPTPSPHLVMLVASDPDLVGFLAHGRELADYLTALLEQHGRRMGTSGETVLDFGCGCGRLARHLAPLVSASGGRFIGLDINDKLIAWCADNLPGEYRKSRLQPPAPLDEASVDLLYSVSVFTHLPLASMDAWLVEFARVLKPGGLALVSFADEGRIEPARLKRLEGEGAFQSTRALEGSNYMSSYVLSSRFATMAAGHLQVLEVIPSRQSGQTLAWAVLAKPAPAPAA